MVNTITYTTVKASWLPPEMPNGVITRYDLEFREAADLLFRRRFPTSSATSYTITGLFPSTTYQFRIAAVTVVGHGPYSSVITINTTSKLICILEF